MQGLDNTVDAILSSVAGEYGVTVDGLLGRSQYKSYASARRTAYQRLFDSGRSDAEIARIFGRDRTTILTVRKMSRKEPTALDRLGYHMSKLVESLDMPEDYRRLNDHDIREAYLAFLELKGDL